MKLNKKGFMLAEVVVVAAVISTALVTMYIGLNRLTQAYETRNRYYDIDAMQIAMEVNDLLVKNDIINTCSLSNNNYSDLYSQDCLHFQGLLPLKNDINLFFNSNIEVYYVKSAEDSFMAFNDDMPSYYEGNSKQLALTSIDYINYLSNNISFDDYSYLIVVFLQKDKNDNDSYYYYTLKVGDNNA